MIKKSLFLFLITFFIGCIHHKIGLQIDRIDILENIKTIEELDSISVFSFAIMSDNKGESPYSRDEFLNMVNWIEESGDRFVIGLGDHLKKDWENTFIEFLDSNIWWQENFYPNVADGENEYFGEDQHDWGAGAPMLDLVNFSNCSDIVIRENKCEYYAKIDIEDYTIHLIQLHFSDQPRDPAIAFNEDSRLFLINTLCNINKSEKDIIIVGAHSITGSWIELFNDERRELIMEKCDLILSATTHFFKRIEVMGFLDSGALCLNTGSVTYPSSPGLTSS